MTFEVDVRDVDFIDELAQFHERREEAIDLPLPSDLLLALYGYARGIIALQMFEELEVMATASDLLDIIKKNRKRVDYLGKRAGRLLKNEPNWKPSTRKRNTYKARAWLREGLKLTEEAKEATEKLKQLEEHHG